VLLVGNKKQQDAKQEKAIGDYGGVNYELGRLFKYYDDIDNEIYHVQKNFQSTLNRSFSEKYASLKNNYKTVVTTLEKLNKDKKSIQEEIESLRQTLLKDTNTGVKRAEKLGIDQNTLQNPEQFFKNLREIHYESVRYMYEYQGLSNESWPIDLGCGLFGSALLKASGSLFTNTISKSIAVYRVEGAANQRIVVDNLTGNVAILDDSKVLFLNFGQKARAKEFLKKRFEQGILDAQIKEFKVKKEFLDELRKNAVKEIEVHEFPNSPIVVDPTKAPDQFGLRPTQIDKLIQSIIQGTGKNN
jgi:uncharacterized protein YukE